MFALLCVCSKPSAARIRFARTLSICNNQQENDEEELFASIGIQIQILREGCKKSKWKFKMAFAMKGGGGLEGVSSATYLFWKMIFLKTI